MEEGLGRQLITYLSVNFSAPDRCKFLCTARAMMGDLLKTLPNISEPAPVPSSDQHYRDDSFSFLNKECVTIDILPLFIWNFPLKETNKFNHVLLDPKSGKISKRQQDRLSLEREGRAWIANNSPWYKPSWVPPSTASLFVLSVLSEPFQSL